MDDKSDLMTYILIAVIVALGIQAITSFWLTKLLSVEAQHLISQLRVQVQKKILTLPISYFDNNKSGALVSRIMTDVEGVRNLVGTGFVQLIGGSLTAIVALVWIDKYKLDHDIVYLNSNCHFRFYRNESIW